MLDGVAVQENGSAMSKMADTQNARGRVTLVELNEFNPVFLRTAAQKLDLRHIGAMLDWSHTSTTTDDRTEHQGLDPWVQWVNVHSGKPSSEHGVKRLGDTRDQRFPPFWIRLAEQGVSWGAWGVMNTPRVDTRQCRFFFPDPWSYEEDAYPAKLEGMLRLPRYVSKNYLDLDRQKVLSEGFVMAANMARPSNWPASLDFSWRFLSELTRRPNVNIHTLTTFIDYLGFCFFRDLSRKSDPRFRVIFLNLIAHLQHQFWRADEDIHPEMELGLRLTDRILGRLIAGTGPDDVLIVMNGLRQKNVAGEGFHVYRQNNPVEVLKWVGAEPVKVEQCMTHDAHAHFADAAAADHAVAQLDACELSDGTKAFFVERLGPTQVFYQISFEHALGDNSEMRLGNRSVPLSRLISLYAIRTGAHIPEGDVYTRGLSLPRTMYNHEIAGHIEGYFQQDGA